METSFHPRLTIIPTSISMTTGNTYRFHTPTNANTPTITWSAPNITINTVIGMSALIIPEIAGLIHNAACSPGCVIAFIPKYTSINPSANLSSHDANVREDFICAIIQQSAYLPYPFVDACRLNSNIQMFRPDQLQIQ